MFIGVDHIKATQWNSLPVDIYLHVFQFFDHRELCRLSLVNRWWKVFTNHENFWRQLYIAKWKYFPESKLSAKHCYKTRFLAEKGCVDISGIIEKSQLTDSVGIETAGGIMYPIFKKGSSVPCEKTLSFTTYADNQSTVLVQVFHGSMQLTKNCTLMGKFVLSNITPQPRGIPKILISFKITKFGYFIVSASEQKRELIVKKYD